MWAQLALRRYSPAADSVNQKHNPRHSRLLFCSSRVIDKHTLVLVLSLPAIAMEVEPWLAE